MNSNNRPVAKYYVRIYISCLAFLWMGYCWPRIYVPTLTHMRRNGISTPEACLLDSGFLWEHHVPHSTAHIMSMPQFALHPTGFASRSDWVIGSRQTRYKVLPENTAWGDTSQNPRTIFVRTELLQTFYHRILPCISHRFVLISGDTDNTLPRQVDRRSPKFLDRGVWHALHTDKRIIHHFAENLDELDQRVTALPIGINPGEMPENDADSIVPLIAHNVSLHDRPLTVLQSDRIRRGAQWLERAHVLHLCNTDWSDFCHSRQPTPENHVLNPAINATSIENQHHMDFLDALSAHSFVLCPHGGGLDPSPKAWEAIAMGTIPIIRHFAGDGAYRQLPVVFVDAFDNETISIQNLKDWRGALAKYYEDRVLRKEVIRRLMAEFWWNKVEGALRGTGEIASSLAIEWRRPQIITFERTRQNNK